MSEVKRYAMIEVGLSYHKRTEMKADADGSWVYFEDYAALELENKRNLKSAQYAAETNRKVVRTNEALSDKLASLQQKLDAVLAENVALRKAHPQPFGPEMMKAIDAYIAKEGDVPEQGMMDAFFILRDSITLKSSQVDTIINEFRAEGANAVADYHKERFEFLANTCKAASGEHKAAYLCALDVANQLRAGNSEGATHD